MRREGGRELVPRWRGERGHLTVPSAAERGMWKPKKGTQDVSSLAERLRQASWSWGPGAQGRRKAEWMGKSDVLPSGSDGACCLDFAFQELCTLTRARPPLS